MSTATPRDTESWAEAVVEGSSWSDAHQVVDLWDSWVEDGLADLPLTGRGGTWSQWSSLARIAARNGSLALVCAAHLDALSVVRAGLRDDTLTAAAHPGRRWAWWGPQTAVVELTDDDRVVVVPVQPSWWAATDAVVVLPPTCRLRDQVLHLRLAEPAGAREPRAEPFVFALDDPRIVRVVNRSYAQHPLYWVVRAAWSALWWGAASQLADDLHVGPSGPLAERGRLFVSLAATRALLRSTAEAFDASPDGRGRAEVLSLEVQALDCLRKATALHAAAPLATTHRDRLAWATSQLARHDEGTSAARDLGIDLVERSLRDQLLAADEV